MTKRKHGGYEIVHFPKVRHAIVDHLRVARRKHMIHALVEVDVTKPRLHIRQHKARTEESLSFTAFIIACLARAVEENKTMHAYRKGRNQLVLFNDVDVSTVIEHEVDGHKIATPYVIRAANKKTFREIHQEIRAAQTKKAEELQAIKRYPLLPSAIRRLFWWAFGRYPHLRKRIGGTVTVTAIGMFGRGVGWGIPITDYTLGITLGGIADKPGIVEARIEIREYLSMTISVDHDIIDGAPAARFAQRLKELIESGHGLSD